MAPAFAWLRGQEEASGEKLELETWPPSANLGSKHRYPPPPPLPEKFREVPSQFNMRITGRAFLCCARCGLIPSSSLGGARQLNLNPIRTEIATHALCKFTISSLDFRFTPPMNFNEILCYDLAQCGRAGDCQTRGHRCKSPIHLHLTCSCGLCGHLGRGPGMIKRRIGNPGRFHE
jgi:hypothetical protein